MYNPTGILSPDNSRYFIAIREGSCPLCPGYNVPPPYRNQVDFGIADNPRGPVKFCSLFTLRSRGYRMFNGPEDARFMYIAPPGSNGNKTLHMIYVLDKTLHLSQVHYSVFDQNCSAKVTNILDIWAHGTNKNSVQKNWMFIPDSTTSDGKPLFVYKLNTLEVLAIDMKTGEGNIVSSQPKLRCIPNLRGSTMFLHHPSKPNVFIAIAHENDSERHNYYSRVITIEEYEPQHFRLTGMSDRFGIPPHNDEICIDRIHFMSSMMYGDQNNETIIISMGYLDCTIHTVQVPTSHFLSSVKPLSCS